ncbi:MAG TPA: serine hydroxymethyltransferase, partial [Phycisphaerales bacterium]|nr:serine hydroxymethyltransferase [Phycisphaerales bacterium]
FKTYQQQVVKNAQALASALTGHGFRITSGGTDNHLMLVDLTVKDSELTGKDAEKWLELAGLIT